MSWQTTRTGGSDKVCRLSKKNRYARPEHTIKLTRDAGGHGFPLRAFGRWAVRVQKVVVVAGEVRRPEALGRKA
jgi:hypothetical protein